MRGLPGTTLGLRATGGSVEVSDELAGIVVGTGNTNAAAGAGSGEGAGIEEHLGSQHNGAAFNARVEKVAELETELVAECLWNADLELPVRRTTVRSAGHRTTIVQSAML
jgi:hypothetical protein